MARQQSTSEENVREWPAWILPLLVGIGVFSLSVLLLYYYFGPTPREILGLTPKSTASEAPVYAIVGNLDLSIPANYTRYELQRAGGAQDTIDMHALLPDMQPFSADKAAAFDNNESNSDVIYFSVHTAGATLRSDRRLDMVYARYLANPKPTADPYGMDHYAFKPDSAYADQDLFVAKLDSEFEPLVVLICDRETDLVPSPNCTRTLHLTDSVALTYRYKRSHRKDWQAIDKAIVALVRSFIVTDNGLAGG